MYLLSYEPQADKGCTSDIEIRVDTGSTTELAAGLAALVISTGENLHEVAQRMLGLAAPPEPTFAERLSASALAQAFCKPKPETPFVWEPWEVEPSLEKVTEPPCRHCSRFQPERREQGLGVTICHANEQFADFSCFRSRNPTG